MGRIFSCLPACPTTINDPLFRSRLRAFGWFFSDPAGRPNFFAP